MVNVSCVPPMWPTKVSEEGLAPSGTTWKSVQPVSSDTFTIFCEPPAGVTRNCGNLLISGLLEFANVEPSPVALTVLTGRNCASSAGVRPTVRHGLQLVTVEGTVWMDCAAPVT